jgi:hypothetical protein
MVKLPQGDIFAPGPSVAGSKTTGAKTWRYCPYSTEITGYNQDMTVPPGEKVSHTETNGMMHVYGLGGVIGWVCADNDCPFYVGSAITTVPQAGRRFVASGTCPATEDDLATLSGNVQHLSQGRKIVAGTRYIQI